MPCVPRAAFRAALLIQEHAPAIAALIAGLAVVALYVAAALAVDGEKWGHDPETRAWFRSLHSPGGTPCCDYADGVRIEDPDWSEAGGGEYAVFARGRWIIVPPDRVVKPAGRKVSYAVLWWPEGWPEPSCFLPGAGG